MQNETTAEVMKSTGDSIKRMSDSEVLALANSTMEKHLAKRQLDLLDKQQSGELTTEERLELEALLNTYQVGQLRKAQAMAEAERQGLKK